MPNTAPPRGMPYGHGIYDVQLILGEHQDGKVGTRRVFWALSCLGAFRRRNHAPTWLSSLSRHTAATQWRSHGAGRRPLGAQSLVINTMNNARMYGITPHVAEIYDQSETYSDDIELIQKLAKGLGRLRILEPFCGTGRILIPLALAGHTVVGFDKALGMLSRAKTKIEDLDQDTQSRISLFESDVIQGTWPEKFDLVIFGGNCFYELATPEEQEKCIMTASSVLNSGGHIYVDNNHMEGGLDPSWQAIGLHPAFPTGVCNDGTSVETLIETIWYDIPNRLVKFRRLTKVKSPNGNTIEEEYFQQKHPVSTEEVQSWLEKHGFMIEKLYGDRKGNPYSKESGRAIFWARKP